MHISPTKYKIFLGKGALPLTNPQNRIKYYAYILTEKWLKLCIYGSQKYAFFFFFFFFFLSAATLRPRPPEIIYFCRFRWKRAWNKNCAYLALKIQNFLMQGVWFPKIHILLRKEGLLPCYTNKPLGTNVNFSI